MNPISALHQIASLFEESDFEFRFEQKPGFPPLMLVDLEAHGLLCEMFLTSDFDDNSEALWDDLVFLTRFPLDVRPDALEAVESFVALLSGMFGFGSLSFCESTGMCFHRALVPLFPDEADLDVLARVLSQIQLILQAGVDILRETAQGAHSFASAKHLLAERGFPEPPLEAFPEPEPSSFV
jgi:hypothetical protein